MCLTLCSSPDSSTFSLCAQICPEWSWWGTRTPSWDPVGCPSWDRRSGASWPSPTNPCSPSIWRRRWSLWPTTAWLWTSGTLWFTWFSNGNISVGLAQPWRFPLWHVTVKLVIMTRKYGYVASCLSVLHPFLLWRVQVLVDISLELCRFIIFFNV